MSDSFVLGAKGRVGLALVGAKNKMISWLLSAKKGCQALLKHYRLLPLHLKVAVGAGVGVVMLVAFVAVLSTQQHKSSSAAAPEKAQPTKVNVYTKALVPTSHDAHGINNGLTDLQAKLANIEKMLSSRHSVVNIDKVRSDIHGLNKEITQIEQDNKAQYSALRSQLYNLSSQMVTYQKTTASKLDEIEAVNNKIKCLSSEHLPFAVQSIDMVNGRNVVSILYDNMVSPLERNFTLAGWKLSASDYAHQTARFVNKKGVCVSVNLNGSF